MGQLEQFLSKAEGLVQHAKSSELPEGWENVAKVYQQIVSIAPDPGPYEKKLGEAKQRVELANLYLKAREAEKTEDWSEAVRAYRQVVQLNRNYRDAAIKLTEAQDSLECERLNYEAQVALNRQDWGEAQKKLKRILTILPNHKNVAVLSYELELWLEAETYATQESWLEAVKKLEQLNLPPFVELAPDKITYFRLQDELASQYQLGMEYYRAKEWSRAMPVFRRITSQTSDYKDVPDILRELKRREWLDPVVGMMVRHPVWTLVTIILVLVFVVSSLSYLFNSNLWSSPASRELATLKVIVAGDPFDMNQMFDAIERENILIEIVGLDQYDHQIPAEYITCKWEFVGLQPVNGSDVDNRCSFDFLIPSNETLPQQSAVLIDVSSQDGSRRQNKSVSLRLKFRD